MGQASRDGGGGTARRGAGCSLRQGTAAWAAMEPDLAAGSGVARCVSSKAA